MKTPKMTVSSAASFSGLDRKTVAKRLAEAKEHPDADGLFSLEQIVRGLCGGMAGARLRKTLAEASLAELELDRAEKSVVPTDLVTARWLEVITGLRGVVLACGSLSKPDRHALLRQLQNIPLSDYVEPTAPPADDEDLPANNQQRIAS